MPSENLKPEYDVVIVGGGAAGLSAALVLGRCRRSVLVCDAGNPRNAASRAAHGFLTRDGANPAELLQVGREEVTCYGVTLCQTTVTSAGPDQSRFRVEMEDGVVVHSRKLLLATGVVDKVPQLEGIDEFYGLSVHHCPYCDGWEHSGQPLAAYGKAKAGAGLSVSLKTWTEDVVLCTDGPGRLLTDDRDKLARYDIRVIEKPIARLEGSAGQLSALVFRDGERLERRGMFFSTGNVQRSKLPASLGCQLSDKGAVKTDQKQCTSIRGLYVAGDACHDMHYLIVAASEGAKAAMAINGELQAEDRP